MDLAALLDFICLGIGRLDLLASVELCRDPDLSHGGELDICPLAPQTGQRGSPGFQGEAVFLASLCPPALGRLSLMGLVGEVLWKGLGQCHVAR